jgi:hypothetical protein
VGHHTEAFVGIDTSKLRNAVAIADGGRGAEVRYLGGGPATEAAIQKLVAKLAAKYRHLSFCYEAEWDGPARAPAPPVIEAGSGQRRRGEHALSQRSNYAIAVIGIDIGKNSFHVVGQDQRGAIVLRQK